MSYIPQYQGYLGDFLSRFRLQMFRSHQVAADYFGCHRSTITRYENGDSKPPVGYIAHLAQLFYERHEAEPEQKDGEPNDHTLEPNESSQVTLLHEVNDAIRNNYHRSQALHSWNELIDCSTRYMAGRIEPALQEIDESGLSRQSEDIGGNSSVQGETLSSSNFPQRNVYWGVSPDISTFYYREDELATLFGWIRQNRSRIVVVSGLGGMGKSMLAKMSAVEVASDFVSIIWLSLRHAMPLDELLRFSLQLMPQFGQVGLGYEQTPNNIIDISTSVTQLLDLFIETLRRFRCLLILDNLETLMAQRTESGAFQNDFADYAHFLHHIATVEHQSCLLLTTREVPSSLLYLEGEESPVQLLRLQGVETSAARAVLAGKQLSGTQVQWEKLVTSLSGNLLTLKMTGSLIRILYQGDIGRFLEDAESTNLLDVESLIREQVDRLSQGELDVLVWLAIEQEPTLVRRIQQNFVGAIEQRAIFSALQSLDQRSLILRSEIGYTLHDMVSTFLLQRLVNVAQKEITSGEIDWLNRFALVKAESKEYIRQIQELFIFEPLVNLLLANFRSQDHLVKHLLTLIDNLRRQPGLIPGYAGGNLFNLLRYMNVDLTGSDFSQLPIWQAYMLDLPLRDVDFAHADLRSSVFSQLFDRVLCLAYAPDGSLLATGTAVGDIRLWDVRANSQHLLLKGHNDWVRQVAFTPDGQHLFSTSDDQTVRQWDVETGQLLRTLHGHSGRVLSLALDPTGTFMATGGEDAKIRLWQIESGDLIRTMAGHTSWVWSLAFYPEGNTLISGSGDHTIRVWDTRTGTCMRTLGEHASWVWDVAYSPNGRWFASCGNDRTVRLWESATGRCIQTWTVPNRTRGLAFSPDSQILACGDYDNHIHSWDVESQNELAILKGHSSHIWDLAFSPCEPLLVSSGDDSQLCLWSVESFQQIGTISGYNPAIYDVAIWRETTRPNDQQTNRPNDQQTLLLACAGEDRRIHIWDVGSGACLETLVGHTDRINALAFGPDGKTLLSGSSDTTVQHWDLETGRSRTMPTPNNTWIRGVAIAKQRDLMGAVHETSVHLWELSSGKPSGFLPICENEFYCLAIDPLERWLAGGNEDGRIWLWDLTQGLDDGGEEDGGYELDDGDDRKSGWQTLVGHTGPIWSIDFLPADNAEQISLVSASTDNTARLWDVEARTLRQTLTEHADQVVSVAASPSGTLVASGSVDTTVRVWDVASGECIATLEGHESTVYAVCFVDEQTLASGSKDGTVRLWNLEMGQTVRVLQPDRLYERMDITGVTGISEVERESLLALGAVEGCN
ncbi:MAG: hypothetical protein AAF702_25255 [Chloroflexota bacterium]